MRSCATVRLPTTGAVTPGRSRTQASATSVADTPRPPAAVDTASATDIDRSSSRAEAKPANWRIAARDPLGTPDRYFPVSTPPPSGE